MVTAEEAWARFGGSDNFDTEDEITGDRPAAIRRLNAVKGKARAWVKGPVPTTVLATAAQKVTQLRSNINGRTPPRSWLGNVTAAHSDRVSKMLRSWVKLHSHSSMKLRG